VLFGSYLIIVDLLFREASGVGVLRGRSSGHSGGGDEVVVKDDHLGLLGEPVLGLSHVLRTPLHVHGLGGHLHVVSLEHVTDAAEGGAAHCIGAGNLGSRGEVLDICRQREGGREGQTADMEGISDVTCLAQVREVKFTNDSAV
jgi:hypothetical protein